MFELFGGRDADPEDAYLGEVEAADIYIRTLGRPYGKAAAHALLCHPR